MRSTEQLTGQVDMFDLLDGPSPEAPAIYAYREPGYRGMTRITTGDVCGFCRKRPRTETHAGCAGGPWGDNETISIRYCGKCCDTVMQWRHPVTMLENGEARLIVKEAGR